MGWRKPGRGPGNADGNARPWHPRRRIAKRLISPMVTTWRCSIAVRACSRFPNPLPWTMTLATTNPGSKEPRESRATARAARGYVSHRH